MQMNGSRNKIEMGTEEGNASQTGKGVPYFTLFSFALQPLPSSSIVSLFLLTNYPYLWTTLFPYLIP